MAQYPNLPGIEVQIADGGLILPEDSSTESLLIIAPSLEALAPTEPVLVRQSSDLVSYSFGDFVKGGVVNPIAAAWKAAYDGGCRRIYLMAMSGTTDANKFLNLQDSLFGILADFTVDHVALVGVYADKEAVLVSMPALEEGVVHEFDITGTSAVTFPLTVSTGTNDTIVVKTKNVVLKAQVYSNDSALEVELNSELAASGVVDVLATVNNGVITLRSATTFALAAPTSGSALTNLKLVSGSSVEKITGNFAKLVGQYAETQTINHSTTIGYIGVQAPATNSLADVKANVDRLDGIMNQYSGYVSVVAGPELGYNIPGLDQLFYTNGSISYAALVCGLKPESATTQKRIYGVAGVSYQLSLRQLNALTGNKMVTFRVKNNQVIVTDGITTAPDLTINGVKRSSDFTRLSTLRITQAAAALIREVCEPFIGEPNRMPQYNAMNASVKAALESMKTAGAINDYRFTITAAGASLNEALVTLEIIPALELRKVTLNISLTPNF
jgi:hypothetical protein